MSAVATTQKRVVFDFEIDFSNGGGLQGQGFRLDIEGEDISEAELADYIVTNNGSLEELDRQLSKLWPALSGSSQ